MGKLSPEREALRRIEEWFMERPGDESTMFISEVLKSLEKSKEKKQNKTQYKYESHGQSE